MIYRIEIEGYRSDLFICSDMERNIAAAGMIIPVQIGLLTGLTGHIIGIVKSGIKADLGRSALRNGENGLTEIKQTGISAVSKNGGTAHQG